MYRYNGPHRRQQSADMEADCLRYLFEACYNLQEREAL